MKSLLPLVLFIININVFAQQRYDVVIDEIMADPSPVVGLPNNEWIELKNTSRYPVNLQNWRLSDAGTQSGPFPSHLLQPDSFLIICNSNSLAAMSVFGKAISITSFPSLDNDEDILSIKSADGTISHTVNYSLAWYKNELKQEGGWSLEMIDTKNPCSGVSNWRASDNSSGGTPGKKNSMDAINPDTDPPQLVNAYMNDSITIIIEFDEPVDSFSVVTLSNYTIDGDVQLIKAIAVPPLYNTVQLRISSPMIFNKVYTIMANNIKDCGGNTIASANTSRIGRPVDPQPNDLIINEILFDPRPNGYDYVEFYNNSNKIVDALKIYIANRNSNGVISSIKSLTTNPQYIFPGDYIVVTENPANLALFYFVKQPQRILPLSLPSFPDDEGYVVALNANGAVIDEVNYKDDWHFKLIADAEGVSLERIDAKGGSNDPANWHSAGSAAGYGTPGYKNSQYKQSLLSAAVIDIDPDVFSPDNDGYNDFVTIKYRMTEPGFAANIIIYDAAGRAVRHLVRNAVMTMNGYWNWDGLNDTGGQLPVGEYIIYVELFNLHGKKERFKKVIALVRK